MQLIRGVLWGLCLVSFTARSQEVTPSLNFEKLVDLISRAQVRSIDQLLPLLPPDYLNQYVLMHTSKSVQGSSAQNPRVLSFGLDASLILAFNGHPVEEGYNSLEILQFRSDSRSFELREIDFSETAPLARLENSLLPKIQLASQPRISKVNPKECLGCHGTDPRPLWEPYNQWPGAFGSDSNTIDLKHAPEQYDLYEKFLEYAKTSSRYSPLGVTYNAHIPEVKLFHFLTTEALNVRAAQWNFYRIARIMQSSAYYNDYKFAVVGTVFCDAQAREFLPPALATRHDAKLVTHDELGGDNPFEARVWAQGLNFIFEPLGYSTREWSMDFGTRGKLSSGNRYNTPAEPDQELVGKLAYNDPELQPFVSLHFSKNPDYPGWLATLKTGACRALMQKSQERLSRLVSSKSLDLIAPGVHEKSPRRIPNVDALLTAKAPVLMRRCASCHSTNDPLVPKLPFDQPQVLAKLLAKDSSGRQTLLNEIRARLSDNADPSTQMPPRGASARSRNEVLRFLESLAARP